MHGEHNRYEQISLIDIILNIIRLSLYFSSCQLIGSSPFRISFRLFHVPHMRQVNQINTFERTVKQAGPPHFGFDSHSTSIAVLGPLA
jgi:hypothetical protein